MRLTIEAGALASLIGEVSRIAEGRSIPILGSVLLDADAETLSATGTNMDILLSGRVPVAGTSLAGRFCVAAEPAARFVGSLSPSAQVEVSHQDDRVTFRSGRARASFSTHNHEDFPIFGERDPAARFVLSARDMESLLGRVAFAASSDDTRPYLNGVHLRITGGRDAALRGEATDGHRVASVNLPRPQGAEAMPSIIVPRPVLPVILRLAKDGDISVSVSTEQMTLTFPSGWRLTTKLLNYTFPDTDRVTPAPSEHPILTQRATMISAVKRVSIAAADSGNRGGVIVLEAGAGELRLSGSCVSKGADGDAEETVDVDYSGEFSRIGFNSRYLLDALNAFTSEEIEIHLNDPDCPVMVLDPRDPTARVAMMPMRV